MDFDAPDAVEHAWIVWLSDELARRGRPVAHLDVVIPSDPTVGWKVTAALPKGGRGPLDRHGTNCHLELPGIGGGHPLPGSDAERDEAVIAAGLRLWRRIQTACDGDEPAPSWSVLAHPLVLAACLAIDGRRDVLPAVGGAAWSADDLGNCWLDLDDQLLTGGVWLGDVAVEALRSGVTITAPRLPETLLTALPGAFLGILMAMEATGHPEIDAAVAGLRIRSAEDDPERRSARVLIEPARWIPYGIPPGSRERAIMAEGPVSS